MASRVPDSYLGRSFAGFVRECAPPTVLLDLRVARAVLRRSNPLDPPDLLGRGGEVMRRIIDLQADISPPCHQPQRARGRRALSR
jgi:hypothetical protein